MYCENCSRITEEAVCPACGNRKLRSPGLTDPCFLTEQDFIFSGILEDVLKQKEIPFLKKSVLGAGVAIKVGPMLDRNRFFVPFGKLQEAIEVVDELLPPSPEADENPDEPESGC